MMNTKLMQKLGLTDADLIKTDELAVVSELSNTVELLTAMVEEQNELMADMYLQMCENELGI